MPLTYEQANHGKSKGRREETVEQIRRSRDTSRSVADWGNAKPELLAAAVRLITAEGDAVMFGITTDGGAHVFNIYHRGVRNAEYIGGRDSLDEFLEGVIRDYE